jgi:uncharacterized protein
MEYAIEKWGGAPHYRGPVRLLGEDEHGIWLWGWKDRTIWRGETPLFVTEQDALFLVARDAWWSLSWWLGHPEISLYVNIQTPAVWHGDRVTTVDLDLDIVRFNDGRLEIVDRDEFELHQGLYGYPEDLVAAAERATAEAFDLAAAGAEPFAGAAAERWIERARREAADGG